MMAHPNGDIYVTDGYRNSRVHRFTRDGQLVKSWGTPGKAEGEFHLPHSIAFDPDGKLYVADAGSAAPTTFGADAAADWTGAGWKDLGFTTGDLPALLERVCAAGGAIAAPLEHLPERKLRVAFATDPEGHLAELVQLIS